MVKREDLKRYAAKLMFDMNEEEYITLEEEFVTILKQMDLIGDISGIDEVAPMTFPFVLSDKVLREDEIGDYLTTGEVLSNCRYVVNDQVKVAKVVE